MPSWLIFILDIIHSLTLLHSFANCYETSIERLALEQTAISLEALEKALLNENQYNFFQIEKAIAFSEKILLSDERVFALNRQLSRPSVTFSSHRHWVNRIRREIALALQTESLIGQPAKELTSEQAVNAKQYGEWVRQLLRAFGVPINNALVFQGKRLRFESQGETVTIRNRETGLLLLKLQGNVPKIFCLEDRDCQIIETLSRQDRSLISDREQSKLRKF